MHLSSVSLIFKTSFSTAGPLRSHQPGVHTAVVVHAEVAVHTMSKHISPSLAVAGTCCEEADNLFLGFSHCSNCLLLSGFSSSSSSRSRQ